MQTHAERLYWQGGQTDLLSSLRWRVVKTVVVVVAAPTCMTVSLDRILSYVSDFDVWIDQPLSNASGSPGPSTQNFLGEESNNMPPPPAPVSSRPRRRVSERNATTTTTSATSSTVGGDSLFEALSNSTTATSTTLHNPSAWLPEHQQQFMQALMHASGMGGNASLPGLSSPIGDPAGLVDPSAPLIDNPFASLMGLTEPDGGQFPLPGLQQVPMEEPKPKSLAQKVLPLLHLTAIWCLLAYFVLWAEPKTYVEAATGHGESKLDTMGLWRRWAELGQKGTLLKTFRVQVVVCFPLFLGL